MLSEAGNRTGVISIGLSGVQESIDAMALYSAIGGVGLFPAAPGTARAAAAYSVVGWKQDVNKRLADLNLKPLTPEEEKQFDAHVPGFFPGAFDCFPAGTLIELISGDVQPIEVIRMNDNVASYGEFDGTTASVGKGRVIKTFENVADEFLQLAYVDPANGETCHITSIPGHVYLTADGGWARLCDLLDGTAHSESSVVALPDQTEPGFLQPDARLAAFAVPAGQTKIVLADGTVVEAHAWSLQYAAQTADLFEQAEMLVARTEGGLALKPEMKKGWKTYNFEVADTHTYIAIGVRVHIDSSYATGFITNAVSVGTGLKAISDVFAGRYDKASLASGKTAVGYSASGSFVSRDPSNGWTSITNKAGATTVDTGFGWAFGPAVSNRSEAAPQSLAEALGLSFAKTAPATPAGTASAFSGGGEGGGPKPILIDLDGDGVEILTMDDHFVLFDWDDDGYLERTSWVAPDDGFLIFDEGNDGQISSSREVAFTRWLEDGVDLSELYSAAQITAFDTNGDGIISRDEALQALHGTADPKAGPGDRCCFF